jgi:uncharacterized protein (DUF58 family)
MITLAILALLVGGWFLYRWGWKQTTRNRLRLYMEWESTQREWTEGDSGEVWLILENYSWFPLPWIQVTQQWPQGMQVEINETWQDTMVYTSYLLPRQRARRKIRFRCHNRGLHRLPPAQVRYSDGMGEPEPPLSLDASLEWLVRPRVMDAIDVPIQLQAIMGEIPIRRWYQEDPSRVAGVRPYEPGDPFKTIHWRLSAKTGQWMTKQMETTSDTHVYLLLNVQTHPLSFLLPPAPLVDHACRLAATWFVQLEEKGIHYGLVTNASWRGVHSLTIPPGRGAHHLSTLTAALGGLIPQVSESSVDMLRRNLPHGLQPSTLILLTAYWDRGMAQTVEWLRRAGHQWVVVVLGKQENAPILQGLSEEISVLYADLPTVPEEEVTA